MRKRFLVIVAALVSLCGPALADKRVALIVGNSAYQHVSRLDNPKNDARLMADTLRALGFALVGGGALVDLDKTGFDGAVQSFSAALQGADVGLFYYAGHGVQLRGTNYLVPIGANPTREADVDFQMLDIAVVLRQMEGSGTRLNLVILDACRNNPFGGRGLRATAGGLAQMQAPEGTLISYATQPGNVAQDGTDGDSPYTKALAQTIKQPGLGIFDAFNEVGLAVKRATGGTQQPWVSSSPIDGTFYFAAPSAAAAAPPASPSADETTWSFLKDTKDVEQLRRFVEQFPASPHRSEAAAKILALQPQKMATVALPPSGSGQDEPAAPFAAAVPPGTATTASSDPTVGKPKTVTVAGYTPAFAFTPDGKLITVSTRNLPDAKSTIGLKINDESGATIRPLDGEMRNSGKERMLFSPDTRRLAGYTPYNVAGFPQPHVLLWNTATGRIAHTLEGAGAPLAFTRDGRRLVTLKMVDASSTVGVSFQIWDVESGAVLRMVDFQGLYAGGPGAFSADGRQFALLHGPQNRVSLWDTGTGAKLGVFTPNAGANAYSMAFSPDGRWLAVSGEKVIWLRDIRSGTQRVLVGHKSAVYHLTFSPDGRQLVSSGADETLELWDVETGRAIRSLSPGGGDVAYSSDGRRLAMLWVKLTIWPLDAAPGVAAK